MGRRAGDCVVLQEYIELMERFDDLLVNLFNELLRRDAPLEGFKFHTSAVGVGAADVHDFMPFELIISSEDIPREQTPNERAQMGHVISIRPGAADQNLLSEGGSPFRRVQSIAHEARFSK